MKNLEKLLLVGVLAIMFTLPLNVKAFYYKVTEGDKCTAADSDGNCTETRTVQVKLESSTETVTDNTIKVTFTPKTASSISAFGVESVDTSKYLVDASSITEGGAASYVFTIVYTDDSLSADAYTDVATVTLVHPSTSDCTMTAALTGGKTEQTKTGSYISYIALAGIASAALVVYYKTSKKSKWNNI